MRRNLRQGKIYFTFGPWKILLQSGEFLRTMPINNWSVIRNISNRWNQSAFVEDTFSRNGEYWGLLRQRWRIDCSECLMKDPRCLGCLLQLENFSRRLEKTLRFKQDIMIKCQIYSLFRRVVELVLVAPAKAFLDPVVGPESLHRSQKLLAEWLRVLHSLNHVEHHFRVRLENNSHPN